MIKVFVRSNRSVAVNPYDATAELRAGATQDFNALGRALVAIGYFCLAPAAMFSLLVLFGTIMSVSERGLSIPSRIIWPAGMAVSLGMFLATSFARTNTALRIAMYLFGSTTVFCAALYDAQNVVELNAYDGTCGNPVVAGMMFRFACFSAYTGVPFVVAAGLLGLAAPHCNERTDEDLPHNIYMTLDTKLSRSKINDLFCKHGWSSRMCSWTEYEIASDYAELVIASESPILLSGGIKHDPLSIDKIIAILDDADIVYSFDAYDEHDSIIRSKP